MTPVRNTDEEIKAFLDEFAALCAKHGISISGSGQYLSEMRDVIRPGRRLKGRPLSGNSSLTLNPFPN